MDRTKLLGFAAFGLAGLAALGLAGVLGLAHRGGGSVREREADGDAAKILRSPWWDRGMTRERVEAILDEIRNAPRGAVGVDRSGRVQFFHETSWEANNPWTRETVACFDKESGPWSREQAIYWLLNALRDATERSGP